jgi:uncharacterized membrane protein
MTSSWTVVVSYFGYAAALALGLLCWLGDLASSQIYGRVGDQRLDESWLGSAHWLAENLAYVVMVSLACAAAAFVLAALPVGESATELQSQAAQSHRSYLLRCLPVVLGFLVLVSMPWDLHAEGQQVGAAVFGVWSLWVLVTGWRALSSGVAVSGPAFWWVALVALLLGLALFIGLFFGVIKIEGFRMF